MIHRLKLISNHPMNHKSANSYASDRAVLEKQTWPPKKWYTLIGCLFLIHILFYYIFLDSRKIVPRQPDTRQKTLMVANYDTDPHSAVASIIEAFDPSVFAGAHENGVSGFLWTEKQTTTYSSKSAYPSFEITPPTNIFAKELSDVLMPTAERIEVQESPYVPSLKLKESYVRTFPTHSYIQLPDSLKNTWKLPPMELPTQSWNGILPNTVVQAVLGEDGRIFSATLFSSSGMPQADEDAIRAIQSMRLLPIAPVLTDTPRRPDNWTQSQTVLFTICWATQSIQTPQ